MTTKYVDDDRFKYNQGQSSVDKSNLNNNNRMPHSERIRDAGPPTTRAHKMTVKAAAPSSRRSDSSANGSSSGGSDTTTSAKTALKISAKTFTKNPTTYSKKHTNIEMKHGKKKSKQALTRGRLEEMIGAARVGMWEI